MQYAHYDNDDGGVVKKVKKNGEQKRRIGRKTGICSSEIFTKLIVILLKILLYYIYHIFSYALTLFNCYYLVVL